MEAPSDVPGYAQRTGLSKAKKVPKYLKALGEPQDLGKRVSQKTDVLQVKRKGKFSSYLASAMVVQEPVGEAPHEPSTFEEAMASPQRDEWIKAMDAEYQALLENGTWEIDDLPPDRKVVGCKWVFKIKLDANGQIARYKARLVAQGFSQKPGIDFKETFAPVAKLVSIRVYLHMAACEDWELDQMDVKNAYLNGFLEEVIFMRQPEGYKVPGKEEKVLRLKKGLYGLKQAGRVWNDMLDDFLLQQGFTKLTGEWCIYIKVIDGAPLVISVYVDDLVLGSPRRYLVDDMKVVLKANFKMDDLGPLGYILGLRVVRDRPSRVLYLVQDAYIERVLERFGMADCVAVATPMTPGAPLQQVPLESDLSHVEWMKESCPYRSAIGCLMYAMVGSRPDIAVAVGVLSRYLENPLWHHWVAVKRVLRYLRGTSSYGLMLGEGGMELSSWSDSDWAGDVDTRRSTSGYVLQLGSSTVSWSSKRQEIVALSSTEAEYIALTRTAQEVLWMGGVLSELGYEPEVVPVVVRGDNQGALALAKNPEFHPRTKHIAVRYHWIRDLVKAGMIEVQYVPTALMLADMLTKPLERVKFEQARRRMGIVNVQVPKTK